MTNIRRFRVSCSLLLVALLAAGCASNTAPTTSADGPRIVPTVVVLGDSLAVRPSLDQSFPVALQTKLNERNLTARIVNASANGDTTADGVERLDAVLVSDVRILVVALGANDGLKGMPVTAIERNLTEIVSRAAARNVRVLLCGMETPPFHGWQYTVAFHQLFPKLASAHKLPLVPFLLDGVVLNPDMNGEDWVHPNAAGARRIAENVWPYLEPMVRAVLQEVNQG